MRVSRRAVIRLLAAAAAGVGAGGFGLAAVLRKLAGPPALEEAPPQALSAETLAALLAATRAVANERIDAAHYAAFFRWRAEHLRGHAALYERFRLAADRLAGCEFARCPVAAQQAIIQRAFRARAAAGTWRVRLLERDWVLYDRYIVRDVLALFARTDAWVLLGYEAWPGTPRGLQRYQAPLRRKA
jgi:hypothetical protein